MSRGKALPISRRHIDATSRSEKLQTPQKYCNKFCPTTIHSYLMLYVKITTVLCDVLCKLPFSILPKAARPLARPSGASSSPLLASFTNCGTQQSQHFHRMSKILCTIFIILKGQNQKQKPISVQILGADSGSLNSIENFCSMY